MSTMITLLLNSHILHGKDEKNVLPGRSVILGIVLSIIWRPIFVQRAGNNQSELVTLQE